MRLIDKIYIMLKEGTCCIYIFLRTCIDPTQLSRSYPNEEANAADITRSLKKVIYRGVYASIEERLFHVAVYFKIWRKRSERRDPGFARSEAESAK